MFLDLKPYDAAYHRPIPWLPSIPAHWDRQRLGTLLREVDGRSTTGAEQLLRVSQYSGVTERHTATGEGIDSRSESLVGYKKVFPGQLAVNIMLAWNGSLGVSKFDGVVSPAYCVYRFKGDDNPWYFHYLLRSPQMKDRIKANSRGIVDSRLRLYSEDLYRLEAPVPPPEEQVAIVKYLAHANARIEKAITAKRRLIALLESQKIATVNDGVVDDWPLIPVKRALHSMTAGAWGSALEESNDPVRWCVRVADFDYPSGGVVNSPKTYRAIADREFLKRSLRRSDLLLEGSGGGEKTPVGRVVLFDHEVDALCSNFLQRLRPAENVNPEFLSLMLRRVHASGEVRKYIKQTTGIQNLDLHSYMNHEIPMPSSLEQERAVSYIKAAFREIDAVAARLKREIALLREFRTRLVADVVTGKVDVRALAATLPDEVEVGADAGDGDSPELDEELVDVVEGGDV